MNDSYKMVDIEELYGYAWMKPEETGVNADMFVDDGGAYLRDNHVPLVFVRNGYGRNVLEFIPISVSDNPQILDNDISINLNKNVIETIFEFIKVNKDSLMLFADREINIHEFYNLIQKK